MYSFIKKDIYQKIINSKVSIFPSYEEGWGISMFESIMCQRPLIAYKLPVFKEIFNDKLITVPVGNTTQMASKITYFLKNFSNSKTLKYVQDCYQTAKQYDWKNVYQKELSAIKIIL